MARAWTRVWDGNEARGNSKNAAMSRDLKVGFKTARFIGPTEKSKPTLERENANRR
jgi:hypothetical protein